MNEREYAISLLEQGIQQLQGMLEAIKITDGQIDCDVTLRQMPSYTNLTVDATIYHEWSDED